MKLRSATLLDHVGEAFKTSPTDFPRAGAFDYPKALSGWIANLEANALSATTAGGIAIDGGHLTLHDTEHVRRVLHVAFTLVQGMNGNLSNYEIVLLIVAVYLHDIGNILGRAGHEGKIPEVLAAVGTPTGFDTIETRTAMMIARVHGGRIQGSKDTISTLQEKATVWSQVVRPRLLAALLRLADELADDPARANRVQLATSALPKAAEVFHQYAAHLHTQLPVPAERTIQLCMDFSDPTLFTKKMGKGSGTVYLFDEILERSIKCYLEARYCSRFFRPYLEFERVSVDITIFDKLGPELERIQYVLEENGYNDTHLDIYDICPELKTFRGNGKLDGELLASRLIQKITGISPEGAKE